MHLSGIYAITNLLTGKRYIGSAVKLENRFRSHRQRLNASQHENQQLQRAWKKYGSEAFTFAVLLVCDKADVLFFEQRAIDRLKPEYNVLTVAGSVMGYRHTPETRERIRSAMKSRRWTPDHVANMMAGIARRTFTPDAIEKIRAASLGKRHTPETLAKLRASLKDSPAMRRVIEASVKRLKAVSASKRGIPRSPEVREKISNAHKLRAARMAELGVTIRRESHSPEAREKIRESVKRWHATKSEAAASSTRSKITNALKEWWQSDRDGILERRNAKPPRRSSLGQVLSNDVHGPPAPPPGYFSSPR